MAYRETLFWDHWPWSVRSERDKVQNDRNT